MNKGEYSHTNLTKENILIRMAEKQKICPSCGQANEGDNIHCRHCGTSLEGIESVKREEVQVSNSSEPNKVEITAYYKKTKYCLNSCVVFLLIFVIVIMIVPIFLHPLGIIAFFIFLIFLLPLSICVVNTVFKITKGMGPARTFSISDKQIKIMLPEKPIFQINWSEFDTVQVYKSDPDRSNLMTMPSVKREVYSINFLSNDVSRGTTSFMMPNDFNRKTTKKIRSLIEQYASKLNVQYLWDKKKRKKK